jgi:hypothetical protein
MSDPVPADRPWIFHVGYVKTATTFLQRQVFGRAEFGLGLPGERDHRGFLVGRIVMDDGYALDPEATQAAFRRAAAPLEARGLTPVWSEETLLGDPGSRRYDGFANAEKLARCFPDARILITIREQRAMALSVYKEYLKGSGVLDPVSFFGRGGEAAGYGPVLRPDFLAYDRAVAFWQARFGAANVLVLPQEMLRRDPQTYLSRLFAFLGQPPAAVDVEAEHNTALGGAVLGFKRRVNRLFVRSPLARDKGPVIGTLDRVFRGLDRVLPAALDRRIDRRLRERVEARYRGVHAEGNRRLAALTGLPLDTLGYEV